MENTRTIDIRRTSAPPTGGGGATPSWRPTNGVGGMVKFVCNAEDRIGQKRNIEFELEINPDELRAGMAGPARQSDLLNSVLNFCKPEVFEAKRWMCMSCDRQACEMVNTPRLDTRGPQPLITDMLPLFICNQPACAVEARRYTERIIKETSRSLREGGGPDLRQHQMYICAYCARAKRRVTGKLLQCGRCRAAWYCDKQCQKEDWPEHKGICVPPQ